MTNRLPPKKDVARALLLRGNVFVHLDPRKEGVNVPEWLCDQPQLVLQVGLDLPVPIPDLRVDEQGVCGTLSFNRSPYRCEVKWSAVFALVGDDGRGMVWPDALPTEIATEVEREVERRKAEPQEDMPTAASSELMPKVAQESRGQGASRPKRRELPPYLRVVK